MRMATVFALFLLAGGQCRSAESRIHELSIETRDGLVPMHCYQDAGEDPRPVVVMLHGASGLGRYQTLYEAYATDLVDHGFRVCAVMYYSPEDERIMTTSDPIVRQRRHDQRFMMWTDRTIAAVEYLVALPTTDAARVGLLGFSQGGYLAIAVAAGSTKVQAVVEVYGGVPSVLRMPISRLPPLLVLHGEADKNEPVQRAYDVAALAQSVGAHVVLKTYPGAPHGFDGEPLNSANAVDARRRTVDFLSSHLGSAPSKVRQANDIYP